MPVCICPAGHLSQLHVNESCNGHKHYVNTYSVWQVAVWRLIRTCNRKCIVYKATRYNRTNAYEEVCKPFYYLPLLSQTLNQQPELVDLTSDTEEQERIRNNRTHVEPDRNVTQNRFTGLNVTIKKEEPDEAYGGAAVTESDATKMLAGGNASGARPEHGQANQTKQKAGRKSGLLAATQTAVCNQPTNTQDTSSSQSNTSSLQKLSKAKPSLAMHHRHRRRSHHSNVVNNNNFLITDKIQDGVNVIRTGPGVTNGAIHGPNSNTTNTQTGSNNTSSQNDGHSNINQNGPSKPIKKETIDTQGGLNNVGSTTSDSFSIKQNGPSKSSKEDTTNTQGGENKAGSTTDESSNTKQNGPSKLIREGTTNTQGSSNNSGSKTASISSVNQNGPSNEGMEKSYPSGEKLQPIAVINSSGKRMSALIPMENPRDGSCPRTPKSLPFGEHGSLYSVNHQIENDHNYSCSTVTTNDSHPTNTVTTSGGQSATVNRNDSGPSVITTKGSSKQSIVVHINHSAPTTIGTKNISGLNVNVIENENAKNSTTTGNGSGQIATVSEDTDYFIDQLINCLNNYKISPVVYYIGRITGPNGTIVTDSRGHNREDNVTGDQQSATTTGNTRNDIFPVKYIIGKISWPNDSENDDSDGDSFVRYVFRKPDESSEQKCIMSSFEHLAKYYELGRRTTRKNDTGKVAVGTYPFKTTISTGVCATNSAEDSNIGTNINFRHENVSSTTTCKNGNYSTVTKQARLLSSTNCRSTNVTNASNISSDNSKDNKVASINSSYGIGNSTISATNSVTDRNSSTCINSRSECGSSTTVFNNGSCTVMPRSDRGLSSTNCRSGRVTNANTQNIHNNIIRDNSKSGSVALTSGKSNVTIGASNSAMHGNCSISNNSRSVAITTLSKNGSSTAMPTSDGGLSSNANKPKICNNTSSDNANGSNYAPTYSSQKNVNSTIGNIIVSPKEDSSKRESFSDGCSTATSTVASNNRNESNTDNISGNFINVKTANRNSEHPNGDHSGTDSDLCETEFNFDGVQKSLIHKSAGNDNSKGKNDNRTNSATFSNNVDESNTDGNESVKMSNDGHYSDSTATKKLRAPGTSCNSDSNECDTSGGVGVCGTDEESDDDNNDRNDNNDDDDDYDGDDDDDDEDDDNDDGDTDDGPDNGRDGGGDKDESNVHRNKDSLIKGDTESGGDCRNNDMPDSSGSFAESNDTSEAGECTSTDVSDTRTSDRDSCNKRSNMSVEEHNAKRLKLEPAAIESSENNCIAISKVHVD